MFKKMSIKWRHHFPCFPEAPVKKCWNAWVRRGSFGWFHQFMGHLMSCAKPFQNSEYSFEIIVVTGHQETGWHWSLMSGVFWRYIGQKHFFYNAGRRDIWGGKLHLIQAVRIEHSADQAQAPWTGGQKGVTPAACGQMQVLRCMVSQRSLFIRAIRFTKEHVCSFLIRINA